MSVLAPPHVRSNCSARERRRRAHSLGGEGWQRGSRGAPRTGRMEPRRTREGARGRRLEEGCGGGRVPERHGSSGRPCTAAVRGPSHRRGHDGERWEEEGMREAAAAIPITRAADPSQPPQLLHVRRQDALAPPHGVGSPPARPRPNEARARCALPPWTSPRWPRHSARHAAGPAQAEGAGPVVGAAAH